MACRLLSAKALSKPMLAFCQFNLVKWRPFCIDLNMPTYIIQPYEQDEGGITDDIFKYIFQPFECWWRHQMEIFSALLDLCAGNSPVNGEFPSQRPVTRSFDVFFDLRLNKRLSK